MKGLFFGKEFIWTAVLENYCLFGNISIYLTLIFGSFFNEKSLK